MAIKWIKLSEKSIEICRAYYKRKCGECPLRPLCVNKQAKTTVDDQNNRVEEINERAVEING